VARPEEQEDMPTEARPAQAPAAPASDGGRFVPGTLLAGRYRVVGLLGRGGMGHVYRADDLKLGQAVALKFLPPALSRDAAALARLHKEVRLARQISHPNVCRVFDIGEVEGESFLTMEYIDGEDLSSLVRRIGRLPADKALELARQVCAGLAAAHDVGVLHRDLKPANVMIDGRGRARVTDFGLAGLEAELRAAGDASGTPAYMAPEQLAGREFTRRSEVYALGLLLYELFTGRRLFDAATLAEVLRQRQAGRPALPSGVVKDLDPLVEQVISRCLEEDPAGRPASVVQVAASLPGADPLAAVLAAGETPSPEMVAAVSAEGALSPRTAGLVLAGVWLLLTLLSFGDRVNLHRLTPLETSPEVLADRARTLLAGLGHTERPGDRAWGFRLDQSYLGWTGDARPPLERWRRLAAGQPLTYFYWYRESPVPLEPHLPGQPSWADPPQAIEGMVRLLLDPRGRLVHLEVVPPAEGGGEIHPPTDWTPLLAAAGYEPRGLAPAAPRWTLPGAADERAAWNGSVPGSPDLPVRVEAAAHAGRPVSFAVATPWSRAPLQRPEGLETAQRAAIALMVALAATVLVGGLLLARSNLRQGRGDRPGALKVAAVVLTTGVAGGLLDTHPALTVAGVGALVWRSLADALVVGALAWLLYVALEPYVRRHRPGLIVSWTRLLAGEWRNAMVGRDVLVGALLGLGASASFVLAGWLKLVSGAPQPPNRLMDPRVLGGVLPALGGVLGRAGGAIFVSFAILVFVAVVRRRLRSEAGAACLLWALFWAMSVLATARSWPMVVATGLVSGLLVMAVTRLGLLAGVAFVFHHNLTTHFPLALDRAAFYAGTAAMVLALLGAMALMAYRISLGRRGEAARQAGP
jgi:serine/threonine-protein kinase